jgi:hypothetical protein
MSTRWIVVDQVDKVDLSTLITGPLSCPPESTGWISVFPPARGVLAQGTISPSGYILPFIH